MPSIAQCKKLIAEQEKTNYRLTISHYRDMENGIKISKNRVIKIKRNAVQYQVKGHNVVFLDKNDVVVDVLDKETFKQLNELVKNPTRKLATKTRAKNPTQKAKSLVQLRASITRKLKDAARPKALESFSNDEQRFILAYPSYFEIEDGYVYLKRRRRNCEQKVKNAYYAQDILRAIEQGKVIVTWQKGKPIRTYYKERGQYYSELLKTGKDTHIPSKSVMADLAQALQKEQNFTIENDTSYIYAISNPTRQNYDETAIFETHVDETLDSHSAMFQGGISGKTTKSVGSDYTNSRVSRGGKLAYLKIKLPDGRFIEFTPSSSDAYISFDLRKNIQIDGKGAKLKGLNFPPKGELWLVGKLVRLEYITRKAHIERGELVRYYHELGEVGGLKDCPNLFVDHDGMPVLVGGNYDVWKSGIVN